VQVARNGSEAKGTGEVLVANSNVVGKPKMNVQEMREKRMKLHSDATAIMRQETISPADRVKWQKIQDDVDLLGQQIQTEERAANIEAHRQEIDRERFRNAESPKQVEQRMAFDKFLRRGNNRLTERERQLVFEGRSTDTQGQAAGTQALSYTELTAGGAFVPVGFQYEIDEALKYYCPFTDGTVCRVLNTATGSLLPFPTDNDTTNEAGVLAENTADTENPVAVSVVNFGAYKYSSRIIRVSTELMQDSAFNIEDYLAKKIGLRFGRAYETAFTIGTGSAQPTGVVPAVLGSGATPVVSTGSSSNDGFGTASATVGSSDVFALEGSVDPLYRRGARFMLHDKSLTKLKQLLDKYGRPLWVPGLTSNAPDSLIGYPYTINQAMNQIGTAGAGAVMLFGDFSHFIVRKVREYQILRLDERYAEYGQTGFIAFSRVDSNLVDAGTHPINSLSQHS
jgi:HK97 family phage major capsid protein